MTTQNQANPVKPENLQEDMNGTAGREIVIPRPINAVRELVFNRIVEAPRELVFNAWTDPNQVSQWWGPKMFTNPVCELDVRPGGAIYIVMRGPDEKDYPMRGVYQEIIRPGRLVFTFMAFEDGMDNPILEGINTITFEEVSGLPAGKPKKTRLTVRVVVTRATPEAARALAGMENGWRQSLDRMACFAEIA